MVVAQTHDLNDMVEASHIASSAQPLWSDLPIRPASIATNLTNSHEWKSTAASLSLRLLSRAKANSIRRVGVAGTRTGDGATTTLCAILHGLERHPARTVAIDLNFRRPALGRYLGHPRATGGKAMLSDQEEAKTVALRIGPSTAVIAQSEVVEDPLGVALGPMAGKTLDRLDADYRPDLMLFDLPALLDHPDTLAIAPHLDALLLCTMADKTLEADLAACNSLLDGEIPVIGTVLTRCRYR